MVATTDSVKLGILDLSVPQGTHLCGFFRGGAERDGILSSFLREGLRSGDKCLYATEATDRKAVYAELNAEVDVASAGDQLDIVLCQGRLLRAGRFFGSGDARLLGFLGGGLAGRWRVLVRPCGR